MVTGTQVFTSIIAETYGVAGFSIILTWVIAQVRLADPARFRYLRYAAGVLTFGTTSSNVVQTFLAELLVAWRSEGLFRAIRRCIVFGAILAVPIVLLSIAVWHDVLWAELRDPVLAVKHVYWQGTFTERTGLLKVLQTFFTFSFISPVFSWVLLLPEETNMRDFREFAFPLMGQIAAPLWLVFGAVGTVAALAHRQYRWIALGLLAAVAFNVLFHLHFQFRGSLYLYSAHLHFPLFALAAGLAPWLRASRPAGKVYIAAVLLLAVLSAADNLALASAFVTDFDQPITRCPAPCQE